ncbi:MAG: ATP-binding protein [Chloroflexi bacterium]|nr:ATP-binding protein [Chloroflexota bacterium]
MNPVRPLSSLSRRLLALLGPEPPPVASPALILLAGLPGSGKSTLARQLAALAPALIVSSDAIRRTIFRTPTYTPRESGVVFVQAHALTDALLRRGVHVVFDATNLEENSRKTLYRIAVRAEARLVPVWVTAPEDVIQERLAVRSRQPNADSDADWEVYLKMQPTAQPFRRAHFVADTALDVTPVLHAILEMIKTGREAPFPG